MSFCVVKIFYKTPNQNILRFRPNMSCLEWCSSKWNWLKTTDLLYWMLVFMYLDNFSAFIVSSQDGFLCSFISIECIFVSGWP